MDDASVKLEQLLRTNKDFLFPVFSRAHIDDLKNDSTNNKFKDTAFIEEIAGHYMLYYDAINKRQELYLNSPTESLKAQLDVPITDFNNVFSDLNFPEIGNLGEELDKLLDLPIYNFNIKNLDTEKYKDTLMNFIPQGKENLSIRDFMQHMGTLLEQLFDKNNPLYKKTRKVNIEQFKMNQIDYNINTLNEILKKSPFGKDLAELINSTVNDQNKISASDYFTKGFVFLNMLGLDKEKNNKTNFISLSNDSQHAYYGALCDILITEDKGLRLKGELIYNLQNVSTKIMSQNEFIEYYTNQLNTECESKTECINKLIEIIKSKTPDSNYKSSQFNRSTYFYSLDKTIFDFYNDLELIVDEDSGTFLVLSSRRCNYYVGLFYKEVELITNKIVSAFGPDLEGLTNFTDSDKKQISESKWEGRIWNSNQTIVALELNKGTNKLSLVIGPLQFPIEPINRL